MSDFVDPGVNQPNEENSPSTAVLKRLLGRKHNTGVVLPKIRSRISRITKNSDLIRKNWLVVPGHSRREQYKSFGTKLLKKQSQAVRSGKSSIEKVSGHWDQLDMSLSNGAPSDSFRTNVIRPGLGDLGIPSGGQVIAPFNPPTTNNEPSFIERRQERIKNQEIKKGKPTSTKSEKPTRLFSRVEEILPSSRENDSINQTSAQNQKTLRQEVENRTNQIKKSDLDQNIDSVGKDNVVQRQLKKAPIIAQKPEQKKSFPEKLPEIDVQKEESSKPAPSTMDDELKTLAIKPSILKSKIDDKKILEEKNVQRELEKPSTKSSDHDKERKIEKNELIQSPKKIIENSEKKKDQNPRSVPGKEIKPVSQVTGEKKESSSIKSNMDGITPSPEKIQREINPERKPNLTSSTPVPGDQQDFHAEQKLDLPVVSKKTKTQTEENKTLEKLITKAEADQFPEQKKKVPQNSVEEKPELLARKSAENVVKLSRQKMSRIPSSLNDGKSKPKNVLPLIKKIDKKSIAESSIISQKRSLVPTPRNVIQRQSEGRSKKLPELGSFNQNRFTADEKVNHVIQTQKTSNRSGQIKEKNIEVSKRDEPKSKPQPLKIQQTPLSKKITGKFIEKKNVKTGTENIRTVQKGTSPLVMRKLDQPKKQSDQEQLFEGFNGNKQIANQINVDNISVKQRSNKKSTNINSIAEKLLVTQPGRIAIQNSLQKTRPGDLSPSNEPLSEKFRSPSGVQTFDQNSKSVSFVKQKKSSTTQKWSKEEKTNQRLTKSRLVPEMVVATRKIEEFLPRSKEELPVVQMKKNATHEPIIKPDVEVQGPVVQRIIEEPEMEASQPTSNQSDDKLDLPKLAREVYPIIKRWIAVEKERTSGRLY